MRVVIILLWLLVALPVVLFLLRRRPPASRPVGAERRDELVKDPVCETYVVRSRALQRTEAGVSHYFCSDECARRYAARPPA